MIYLKLDIHAYHQLERIHYVSISDSGHVAQPRDSRVRWYIYVDEKEQALKCVRYLKDKDDVGDHLKEKEVHYCRVKPLFVLLHKYFKRF